MAEKISGPTLGQQILAEGPIFGGAMVETMWMSGQPIQMLPFPEGLHSIRDGLSGAVAVLFGIPLGLAAGVGAMFTAPADWGTYDKDGNWVSPTVQSAARQVNRFVLGPDADSNAPRKFQMEGATRPADSK